MGASPTAGVAGICYDAAAITADTTSVWRRRIVACYGRSSILLYCCCYACFQRCCFCCCYPWCQHHCYQCCHYSMYRLTPGRSYFTSTALCPYCLQFLTSVGASASTLLLGNLGTYLTKSYLSKQQREELLKDREEQREELLKARTLIVSHLSWQSYCACSQQQHWQDIAFVMWTACITGHSM